MEAWKIYNQPIIIWTICNQSHDNDNDIKSYNISPESWILHSYIVIVNKLCMHVVQSITMRTISRLISLGGSNGILQVHFGNARDGPIFQENAARRAEVKKASAQYSPRPTIVLHLEHSMWKSYRHLTMEGSGESERERESRAHI